MLNSANQYDFTNCPANIATGRDFSYGDCPRLEQWLWLHELMRTIEARASFLPGYGLASYADAGGKADAFAMWPSLATLRQWLARVNSIVTDPTHVDCALASGMWSEFRMISESTDWPYKRTRQLSEAEFDSKITRSAGNAYDIEFPICPFKAWPPMLGLCTGSLPSSRSLPAVYHIGRQIGFGQLVGSSGGGWNRNGVRTGTRPEDDWSTLTRVDGRRVGAATNIEPFLGMNATSGYYVPEKTAAFYYRVKHTGSYDGTTIPGCDYTYSYEPSSWTYNIADGPWTHHINGLETDWRSAVSIVPVYAIYSTALWNSGSAGFTGSVYIDYVVNTMFYAFPDATGSLWIERNGGSTSVDFIGRTAKAVGDAVCSAVGLGNIPSLGPNDSIPDPVYKIGYAVYVEPVWALLAGTPTARNIGS